MKSRQFNCAHRPVRVDVKGSLLANSGGQVNNKYETGFRYVQLKQHNPHRYCY